jgi:WD40 repeat protein
MSFSPNGRIIATASQDNTVKVWNVENGKLQTTLTGHSNGVYDVSFLSENRLVSASSDHSLKVWQLGERTFKKTLNGHEGIVWNVSFSPNGERIASASADGTVKLWQRDASTNGSHKSNYRLLKTLKGHNKEVLDVSFSPDGQTIATASYDTTVQLWTGNGRRLWILEHPDQVFDVNFSPDGKTIATASRDNIVRLWTFDGKWRKTLLKDHRDWVRDVKFSPNGQIIASASDDHTVKLWNPDGSLITTLKGNNGHKSWVRSVALGFSKKSEIFLGMADALDKQRWRNLEVIAKCLSLCFTNESLAVYYLRHYTTRSNNTHQVSLTSTTGFHDVLENFMRCGLIHRIVLFFIGFNQRYEQLV